MKAMKRNVWADPATAKARIYRHWIEELEAENARLKSRGIEDMRFRIQELALALNTLRERCTDDSDPEDYILALKQAGAALEARDE